MSHGGQKVCEFTWTAKLFPPCCVSPTPHTSPYVSATTALEKDLCVLQSGCFCLATQNLHGWKYNSNIKSINKSNVFLSMFYSQSLTRGASRTVRKSGMEKIAAGALSSSCQCMGELANTIKFEPPPQPRSFWLWALPRHLWGGDGSWGVFLRAHLNRTASSGSLEENVTQHIGELPLPHEEAFILEASESMWCKACIPAAAKVHLPSLCS